MWTTSLLGGFSFLCELVSEAVWAGSGEAALQTRLETAFVGASGDSDL